MKLSYLCIHICMYICICIGVFWYKMYLLLWYCGSRLKKTPPTLESQTALSAPLFKFSIGFNSLLSEYLHSYSYFGEMLWNTTFSFLHKNTYFQKLRQFECLVERGGAKSVTNVTVWHYLSNFFHCSSLPKYYWKATVNSFSNVWICKRKYYLLIIVYHIKWHV